MYEYLKEDNPIMRVLGIGRLKQRQGDTQATNLMYQPTLYMQAVTIGHLMPRTKSVSTNRQSPIFSEPNDAVTR